MTSQLGRIQLGRFQLGQAPAPTPTGSFTATAAPTLGPVYGSGLFTATSGAALRVRGSGGTPLSKFSGILGTIQLGRFFLGRPHDDATAKVQRSSSFLASAEPTLSVIGEGGPDVGAFTGTASPTASFVGLVGKGFIATASPTALYYSGGLFAGTANPTFTAILTSTPGFVATADPGLTIFTANGQPGSCIAGPNTPPAERPANGAF